MSKTVAIVGCTHAGVFAADSILAEYPDYEVHIFERNDTVSFLSCGIALWVGNQVSDPQKMFYSSPKLLGERGAHVHMKTNVESVEIGKRQLSYHPVDDASNKTTLQFDKLVITTGSKPVVPPIDGLTEALESQRVLLCKNWDDGKRIKDFCSKAHKVIVVGAGYIGAELAEQLSLNNISCTLIDGLPHVLPRTCDEQTALEVEKAYTEHGVDLQLSQFVQKVETIDEGVKITTDKGTYTAEYAILGLGFLPRTELFNNQVEMLNNGAITIDEYGRATLLGEALPNQDVFAAGDSATVIYNPTHQKEYIPLATNAVRQGLLIGKNLEKSTVAYAGTQATSAVQLYDLSIAATGLTLADCERRSIDAASVSILEAYRPDFMLDTTPVKASLVYEKRTGRILGAQFVSKQSDVAQAANAVSIAIQAGFSVFDLAKADLLFQPNFSQPINYISSVAMAAVEEMQ